MQRPCLELLKAPIESWSLGLRPADLVGEDVGLGTSGLAEGIELEFKFLAVAADPGVSDQPRR